MFSAVLFSHPLNSLQRGLIIRLLGFDFRNKTMVQDLSYALSVPKLSTPKQCERWSDLMPRRDLGVVVSP